MTVCIAAACRDDNDNADRTLVLCTDGKGGSALGSKEFLLKIRYLGAGWRCLTAGSVEENATIIPLFRKHLETLDKIDETNIVPAVQAAFQERKTQKADEYTQRKWGMTFADFRMSKAQFPEDEYRSDMAAIGQISLPIDCLLAGFLADGLPLIVHAHGTYGVSIQEDFAVAGEGELLAQSGMLHREHYDINSLQNTLYAVFEAKALAERVSTVGKITHIMIVKATGHPMMLTSDGKKYFATQFEHYGPRNLPDFAFKLEESHLKEYPYETEDV